MIFNNFYNYTLNCIKIDFVTKEVQDYCIIYVKISKEPIIELRNSVYYIEAMLESTKHKKLN
jgi:hypothetical protein